MIKKIFLVAFVALLSSSCSKEDDLPAVPEQDLTEKTVEFQLYTEESFADTRYDQAFVKLTLVILTVDNQGKITTHFEKTYDWMHFRDFPTEASRIIEQKSLTYDRNTEVVHVSYGFSFRVNGMLSAEGISYSLPTEEDSHTVVVKL